ncbi:hypothetical protein PMAYCL1PPCAC_01277 [Pristionchus mayeri]|uniref:Uncharacterized protein n=1 Tax=Pristionchus mayeri TaxID=1317129 RepID=A0AAN5C5U7_9BILA|nr:hypothetical protein PMAYCL1PPCAC_01277 [Pristionchus mayeri]
MHNTYHTILSEDEIRMIPHPYSYFPPPAYSLTDPGPLSAPFEPLLASTPLSGSNPFLNTLDYYDYDFLGLSEARSAPAPALNAVGWPILGAAGGAEAASTCVADAEPPLTLEEITFTRVLLAHILANQMDLREIFQEIMISIRIKEVDVKCAQLAMNGYSYSSPQFTLASLQHPTESGFNTNFQHEYAPKRRRIEEPASLSLSLLEERVVQELNRLVDDESSCSDCQSDDASPNESMEISPVQERMIRELEMLVDNEDPIDMREEREQMWFEESPPRTLSRWQRRCLESDDYLDEPLESDEESELAELLFLDEEDNWERQPTDESHYIPIPLEQADFSVPPPNYRPYAYPIQPQSNAAGSGRNRSNRSVFRRFQESNRLEPLEESKDH